MFSPRFLVDSAVSSCILRPSGFLRDFRRLPLLYIQFSLQHLVDKPVLAVPTSSGYGAHFEGLAPLLAMLNSCAEGISVVNIDNGFGAAYQATLINKAGGRA